MKGSTSPDVYDCADAEDLFLTQNSCSGPCGPPWCVGRLVSGLVFAGKKRGIRTKMMNKIKMVAHLSTALVFNVTVPPGVQAVRFHFRRTWELASAFH